MPQVKYSQDIRALPMNFRIKWAAALRSGEYEQDNGVLYNAEIQGFCCLGVAAVCRGVAIEDIDDRALAACDLYGLPQPSIGRDFDPYLIDATNREYVQKMFPNTDLGGRETVCASSCNDDLGMSFDQIAALIHNSKPLASSKKKRGGSK